MSLTAPSSPRSGNTASSVPPSPTSTDAQAAKQPNSQTPLDLSLAVRCPSAASTLVGTPARPALPSAHPPTYLDLHHRALCPRRVLATSTSAALLNKDTPLDSPTDATRQPWARGSERIPRQSADNLGVARSYALTSTRTAALDCACARSHGAASAEHVRHTSKHQSRRTGAIARCRTACESGARRLCMQGIYALCRAGCEPSVPRAAFADLPHHLVSTGQTSF